MKKQDIEKYLFELGQELSYLGIQQPVRILVIGGTFMLEQVGNRSITEDVDVFFKDIQDRRASYLYQTILQAVKAIGARNNLEDAWLNDGFSHMLRTIGGIPEGTLWRNYGVLEVFFPPAGYIFALKLLGYRKKDKEDIEALGRILQIQTRQQAQAMVERHIPNKDAHDVYTKSGSIELMYTNKQPQTMARAYTQICQGERPWTSLGNFMNAWFGYAKDQRAYLVAYPLPEPKQWTQDTHRWAAFIAASVEWLCQKYSVTCPVWVYCPEYVLPETWWYSDGAHKPQVRECLIATTPEPFIRRNIYCGNRMYNNKYETDDLVRRLLEAQKSLPQVS